MRGRDGSEVVDKREGARRKDRKRKRLDQEVAGQFSQGFSSKYLLDLFEVKERSMVEASVRNFLLPLNSQIGQSSRLYSACQNPKTCQ